MQSQVAVVPGTAITPEAPHALALDPDNQVYATVFTAADGSQQEFATHFRPDDTRPLYLRASGYAPVASASFEQARAALIEHVLGGSTAGLSIGGRTDLVDSAKVALRAGNKTIAAPWSSCWVFFIDDKPTAGWEHPCRYVFMAPDLSAFAVQYGRAVLELFDLTQADQPRVLLSTVVANPVSDTTQPLWVPPPGVTNYLNLNLEGSAKNCYAVILSGGADAYNNWQRYWEDSANIYSTLKHKYGFTGDHIIALISDGTDPANDRDIGTRDNPVYANSPTDLDGDGVADTDGPCTFAQVQATFNNLAGVLTANDQLFVFITDHGYQESGWDAGVNLWGGHLRDDQLADMTQNLPCPVMFALETCYSGGFVDDITVTANRVIGTACAYNDTSEGWSHYDPWVYYLTAAVRGYYPAAPPANPWTDGAVCNADSSGDGRVSFNEAWTHAWNNRAASDVPQLGENPAGLGNSLYMNQLQISLNNNSPVSYTQIPKDFSFQIVSSGWAAVGVASASDHDIKADDNRQLTTPYRTSASGGITRDFVVVNGHRIGNATHYAQVYFGVASAYNVEAEWLPSDLSLGSPISYIASANEVFDLAEVSLVAGTSYDATIHITSGTPDLGLYVYTPASDNGSRSSANWSRNAGGAGVDETLTFRPTTSGYHGIVMVNETGGTGDYTITISESPPLAAPASVAATDGTYSDRVRVTWNSVASATHYQVYRNTVNASGSATLINDWTAVLTYDDLTATVGRTYYYWVKAAATVDGDRESAFSAAADGYVLPATLTSDVQVDTTTEPAYYQFRDANSRWWAVGVRNNGAGENWSLRLYSDPSFGTLITSSSYFMPVDYIVGDGHHVAYQYRGVEAYRYSGVSNASVEFEGGSQSLVIGTNSGLSWPAGDVVKMWDVYLTNGSYQVDLIVNSGTADLGLALFGSGGGAYYHNRQEYLASADKAGNGTSESFSTTVTNADYYGLCVWGNDHNAAGISVVITPLKAGLWEGDISSNWHTTGNWNDNHVPTSAVDVLIPAGRPFQPVLTTASGICRNLTVENSATLTFGTNTLYVAADVHVFGNLNMNSTLSRLYVTNDVYWESGSTVSQVGSARMLIYGDWNFESGANVHLTTGYTEFLGTGPSWIRSYEPTCNLYNLNCSKTGGGYVGVSALCVDTLLVNNIYNYVGSSLEVYSSYPLVINGFFNNLGGNFHCHYGTVIYDGSAGLVPLKPNTGDYFNNLIISSTTALSLDATYNNTLVVKGDLTIESSALNANGLSIVVGGDWNNRVGNAGFQAGSGMVTFNRSGTDQQILGETTFNHLLDARTTGGTLGLFGSIIVNSNYTATFLNGVHSNLLVKGTLNVNNPACYLGVYPGAQVTASNLNLGGSLLGYGGSLTASNLVNDGLYGNITIEDGSFTLRQGTTGTDYVDLNGQLTISGGRLDIYGGALTSDWPYRANASLTMSGGILDFKDQGINIYSNTSYSLTAAVTGGVIRSAKGISVQRPDIVFSGGVLEFAGTTSGSFYMDAGSYCHDVLINKTGATVTATSELDIRNDFTIASGVFVAPTNMLVGGDWSNSVGTAGFGEGSNTVTFVGYAAADIKTDETFYNLIVNKPYRGLPLKIYNYELETVAGSTVHVRHDLTILDGCLKMYDRCVLDVDNNLAISPLAGLKAINQDLMIYIGGNWQNSNTNYGTSWGFDPGYSSTVTFDGAVDRTMNTEAATETFNAVRIDRPGGALRVLDAVTVRDDLTILNGGFSYSGGPFTHRLRGDLIIELGGAWYDTVSTVIFDGIGVQNLNHKSMNGWFKHMVVEKNTGISIVPLTLQTNVLLLAGGTLTVREGYMDLNGHFVRCTGNVTVEDGGKLLVNAGAALEVGQTTLEVQSGGLLDVRGASGNPATVQAWNGVIGNRFAFLLRNGATLLAENAVFEYLDAGGLQVQSGATVEEPFTFHGCTFRYGTAGGTLLDLQSSQALTIRNAVFPSNAGGGASNVRKTVRLGRADFVRATGVFAGETYDDDSYNLIDWHSGVLSQVNLAGPTVVTKGGNYDFTATVTGDLPLTPIYYFWTATDLPSALHTQNGLTDTYTGCTWAGTGAKTVRVVASNALSVVQATLQVDAQVLDMDVIGRRWIQTVNAVEAVIRGTSASSTYQIQYRTNLSVGSWTNALPGGVNVPGQNGDTPWTDMGGPDRDVTIARQLFYRAVLLVP